jgi:hypothetical protein
VSFVGALATVALTFLLGRAFSGDGVAWARVAGHLAMCTALVYVARSEGIIGRIVRD